MDGSLKEGLGLDVSAASGEDQWGGALFKEALQRKRHGLFAGQIFERKVPLQAWPRPVGLGGGKPFGEQAQGAIWRMRPVPPKLPRGSNAP